MPPKYRKGQKMKSKLHIIAVILIIISFVLPSVYFSADPDETSAVTGTDAPDKSEPEKADITEFAEGIELYCVDTDTTLFTKNADAPCAASVSAKLMSALVAYDKVEDLEAEVKITSDMLKGKIALIYGFSSGMTTTYNDLITAMLVRNADDAALALSRAVSEELDTFVALMNEKAKELGMENTEYATPTGLGEGSRTTVRDMMKLLSVFSENDYLLSISGRSSIKLASTNVTIYNRNYLLSRYYNGGRSYLNSNIKGGMVDYTNTNLLTVAVVKGYTYLAVVTGGTSDEEGLFSYRIINELLEWGSTSFAYLTLIDRSTVICSMPVTLGYGADEVTVFPAKKVTRYLSKDTDLETAVSYTYTLDRESLTAPVSFGDKVGSLTLFLDGEELETVDLVIASDIPSSSSDYLILQVRTFMKSKSFIWVIIVPLALCVSYILGASIVRGQRRKKIKLMLEEQEGDE